VIVVIYSSMNAMGWGFFSGGGFSYFWRQYGALIIFLAIVVAVIATTTVKPNAERPRITNVLSRLLGED
jgi:flagellar motor component MotA